MSWLKKRIDGIVRLTVIFIFLSWLTRNKNSPFDFMIEDESFENPLDWYKKTMTPTDSYYDCTSAQEDNPEDNFTREDNFTIFRFNLQPQIIQNYRSFTMEHNNYNINSEGGVIQWSVFLNLHFPTMTNVIQNAYLYCLNS